MGSKNSHFVKDWSLKLGLGRFSRLMEQDTPLKSWNRHSTRLLVIFFFRSFYFRFAGWLRCFPSLAPGFWRSNKKLSTQMTPKAFHRFLVPILCLKVTLKLLRWHPRLLVEFLYLYYVKKLLNVKLNLPRWHPRLFIDFSCLYYV